MMLQEIGIEMRESVIAEADLTEKWIDGIMESGIRLTAYKIVLAKGGCNG